MIVATMSSSSSCSDDNSETTTTTTSTVSIRGDNMHDKHVWWASVSALESKLMHVVSENIRLRSEVKRQASKAAKTIADLTERLERLEEGKSTEPKADPVLEARVKSLERIVINGQAPRSRGGATHIVHSSSPPEMFNDTASSVARAATRTRSRSRTRAMSNRVAMAKSVSDTLLKDDETHNYNNAEGIDSIEQKQRVGEDNNEFPILSFPLRNCKKLSSFLSEVKVQGKLESKDNRSLSGQSVASRRRAARNAEAPATPVKKLVPIGLSPVKSQKRVWTEEEARKHGELPLLSPPTSPVKSKVGSPGTKLRDLCRPFTPEQLSRAQAEDKVLGNHLSHGGMYPNFLMSMQSVDDDGCNLYLFRKCVYVPDHYDKPRWNTTTASVVAEAGNPPCVDTKSGLPLTPI